MRHPAANKFITMWGSRPQDLMINFAVDFKPLNEETEWWMFIEGRLIGSGRGMAVVSFSEFDNIDTLSMYVRNASGSVWKRGRNMNNTGDLTPETKACALLLGLPLS